MGGRGNISGYCSERGLIISRRRDLLPAGSPTRPRSTRSPRRTSPAWAWAGTGSRRTRSRDPSATDPPALPPDLSRTNRRWSERRRRRGSRRWWRSYAATTQRRRSRRRWWKQASMDQRQVRSPIPFTVFSLHPLANFGSEISLGFDLA
jgi:hypothetical protein